MMLNPAMFCRKLYARRTTEGDAMAVIADDVLEDIGKVLVDCAIEFRRHEDAKRAKTEGISSLVDLEDARRNIRRYSAFAMACEKYARLAQPTEQETT